VKRLIALIVVLSTLCMAVRGDCPPGDLNGDCRVDLADLLLFAQEWLRDPNVVPDGNEPSMELPIPADLDGSGFVDGRDLALLANHWRQVNCPIVINEVLAHSHGPAPDWIELHNVSGIPVDIGGWFLSDDARDLMQYQIAPGTVVEPNGYIVFYESIHFGNPFDPGTHRPFAFSKLGEAAYLFSAYDPVFPGFLLEESFGASDTGYSFGRYRTSLGTYHFTTMSHVTPGYANAYPLVGPVVINEIMYHPGGDGTAQYVELLNVSHGPVLLFDYSAMEPWRFVSASGIDFRFPADDPLTLEADEYILLVSDLASMQQYSIPEETRVFEWASGTLARKGERLQLLKPGDEDRRGTRYWIEVDQVQYSDGSQGEWFPGGNDPWPVEASGEGLSLNRLFPSRYGNDPNNWHATIPTPGTVND
jgi:hypothetical protein